MSKRILQFGTSRFLQAHVDLFVHEAMQHGQDIGPITIVKTTKGGAREGRIAAFQNPEGYPVHLRGFLYGQVVDSILQVRSVRRAIDATNEWSEVKRVFTNETDLVISNVGECGYEFALEAQNPEIPPSSFPAKLVALLVHRFANGAQPLLILPCELASENGKVLRQILCEIALHWKIGTTFDSWLQTHVLICDTLVDRIVSEALEPIGAIAEPYGLWAIKREAGLVEPLQHPCITYTDNLEPFLRLKLHILNLGHTYLAQIWQDEKRDENETVRGILNDVGVKNRLMALYSDEVIPVFALHQMQEQAETYVTATVERFENPFLNHRMSDIAQNHAAKIERRVADFIAWGKQVDKNVKLPRLEFLVKQVK